MIEIEKEGIERVVVLMSRFTREPVIYTNLDGWLDRIVERCVEVGDYCVLYDGPPNFGDGKGGLRDV
jgi:hypothetical protein